MTTRRRFLQYGMAAGVTLLPCSEQVRTSVAQAADVCLLPTQAAYAASIAFEPFTRDLTVPPVAVPVRSDDVVGDIYAIAARSARAEILPGIQTPVLAYNGTYPGPTIRARVGRPVTVVFTNELSGREASVHLHGARVRQDSDGHPMDLVSSGAAKRYRYRNEQRAATLWYHDHAMHVTAEQVYRGLAAFYLLEDASAEAGLGLPSGARDLPLLLQDRAFTPDGGLAFDPNDHDGMRGDVFVVNGVAHPRKSVDATTYRLRLLNGSNARTFRLGFDAALDVWQIASDGGLLPAAESVSTISLAPAERAELVVDFSKAAGASVGLVSLGPEPGGPLPALVRFDVTDQRPAGWRATGALSVVDRLPAPQVTRRVTLDLRDGRWLLNDRPFAEARVDFFPRLDTVEEWEVVNTTNMLHPLHLHLVMFQVVARSGGPAPSSEAGWKDTVQVRPKETVRLRARFEGHAGRYVYHCHVLEHEDHVMMSQFEVVAVERLAGSSRFDTAAAISRDAFDPEPPVAFVAAGGDYADALTGGPAAAALGGPMLLTAGDSLPTATAEELGRLRPGRTVVLGGPRAVPDSVVEQLRGLTSGAVDRWAGTSRFDTAAAVSAAVFDPGVPVVYVATGSDYPDALAAGAAAAAGGGPVLLVTRDTLPAAVREELARLRPAQVVVMGGAAAVSDAVLSELRSATGVNVERVAGANRFATAAALSERAFRAQAPAVFVATGAGFADALAGVPAAAVTAAGMLLVTRDGIPDVVREELARLQPRRIVVLGGSSAISDEVETQLAAYLPSRGAVS